jgi:hypothetical protein
VMKSAFSENRNAIAATIIANSAVIPTGYESYAVATFYAVPVTLSSPHARPPVQGTPIRKDWFSNASALSASPGPFSGFVCRLRW